MKITNEAVVQQLQTIKSIINPTIKMFEETENIYNIQTNLDAI